MTDYSMSHYYDQKIFIPTVTKTGEITGEIERWEAHEKGILHKAFSVALFYNNQIILQVRKHPVFDSVIDVTASSHPKMHKGKMEDEKGAVVRCLKREWHVDIKKESLRDLGSIYYKSKDPNSKYIEHEYCTFYKADIDEMIKPDPEFAYGYVLIDLDYIQKYPKHLDLAPWVTTGIDLYRT